MIFSQGNRVWWGWRKKSWVSYFHACFFPGVQCGCQGDAVQLGRPALRRQLAPSLLQRLAGLSGCWVINPRIFQAMSRVPRSLGRKSWYNLKVSDLWHLGKTASFLNFFPPQSFPCFSSCLQGGWLRTQEKVWCGCDWQGHDVLSGRLCFRNKIALGNCNGIASSDLSWKCLSNIGMLVLFYPLSFYNLSSILMGRQRGVCYFLVCAFLHSLPSPCLSPLKYLSNARRLVRPGRVRIVYNGRDHSCCCLSACSCLDRGSTKEVGAIGSES